MTPSNAGPRASLVRLLNLFTATLIVLVLSACGGGGEGGAAPPPAGNIGPAGATTADDYANDPQIIPGTAYKLDAPSDCPVGWEYLFQDHWYAPAFFTGRPAEYPLDSGMGYLTVCNPEPDPATNSICMRASPVRSTTTLPFARPPSTYARASLVG